MAAFKCKMCGGTIDFNPGESVGICEFCGTKQTLPKTNDEVITNLFNRANNLRLKCEFDKAEQIYEKIVQQDDSEAEAHWGIILCKYGIEYVEDPKTFERVPTCHRTRFESIKTDTDYEAAIDYSDMLQQSIYEKEAREIDKLQKDILAIAKNEKPFDVFICYKETDDSGKRTVDSTLANDIYHQLTQSGLKVFYAAITLEDKLGQEYEPYIFAALNSAKVMLAIGTKPEYFTSVWVKNEWSRFMNLMKTDRSKILIPCYRDMDAYDLPEEFAHLQAQDMSRIGFIQDIIRGVEKVVGKDSKTQSAAAGAVAATAAINIAPLLKRAFMFLEDENWGDAKSYCERVLDQDPENAQAYLGKLMAELHVRKPEDLPNCREPFDNNSNYQKAVRFGDEKTVATLKGYIDHIKERNEQNRLSELYNKASDAMSNAYTEEDFITAANAFQMISGYKDADVLYKKCLERADECRKDAIYDDAISQMNSESLESVESAIIEFQSVSGWKDADAMIQTCHKRIERIKAKEKTEKIERERRAEQERIAAAVAAKKRKKTISIASIILGVCIVAIMVFNMVIVPKQKHSLLSNAQVGDYVLYGVYNQTSSGKKDIEWLVLDKEDDRILLISRYALVCRKYHTDFENVTWDKCSLRVWLNNDFFDKAFSKDEQAMILETSVNPGDNPSFTTEPGMATSDKIFLLSISEANQYFSSNTDRMCQPTEYALDKGCYVGDNGNCVWWLRSPGHSPDHTACVNTNGVVRDYGYSVNYVFRAVRPAMWLDISK